MWRAREAGLPRRPFGCLDASGPPGGSPALLAPPPAPTPRPTHDGLSAGRRATPPKMWRRRAPPRPASRPPPRFLWGGGGAQPPKWGAPAAPPPPPLRLSSPSLLSGAPAGDPRNGVRRAVPSGQAPALRLGQVAHWPARCGRRASVIGWGSFTPAEICGNRACASAGVSTVACPGYGRFHPVLAYRARRLSGTAPAHR